MLLRSVGIYLYTRFYWHPSAAMVLIPDHSHSPVLLSQKLYCKQQMTRYSPSLNYNKFIAMFVFGNNILHVLNVCIS